MVDYRERGYENLNKARFFGVGKYDLPTLKPVYLDDGPVEMIPINLASKCRNPHDVGLHFFTQDYMITRVWYEPDHYLDMVKRFKFCLTPDFSMYTDYPFPVQLYNHYRRRWCGAYWQYHGATVIPSIGWSDENSFEWCFEGEPRGSTVAVSSMGTIKDKQASRLFYLGYHEMLTRLNPSKIIFYGDIPEGCENNINVPVDALYHKIRLTKGEEREINRLKLDSCGKER